MLKHIVPYMEALVFLFTSSAFADDKPLLAGRYNFKYETNDQYLGLFILFQQ